MVNTLPASIVYGIVGHCIDVEVDIARGFPCFTIVGLPDTVVKESKERIRTAIKNSDFDFPERRVTVNFVPANIKKDGSHLDLPIALGVLSAHDKLTNIDHIGVLGELSLSGLVIPVVGIVPLLIALSEAGVDRVIIPEGNLTEAQLLNDLTVYPVHDLAEAYQIYEQIDIIEGVRCHGEYQAQVQPIDDFSDVAGQAQAKRALEIAAAGGHHIMMMGPPGSGKTMLAKRFVGIMPDLSYSEVVELTKIYSVAHQIDHKGIVKRRPFRSPHHSISAVSLCGGGTRPRPGEISLSHHGVLFLDEFPEFKRSAIEALRQPIEDKTIQIARSMASVDFPCHFTLVAAFNPCPCGFLNDKERECTCSPHEVKRYLSKLSGPIVDRFDMQIILPRVPYHDLRRQVKAESSATIRQRVEAARQRQHDRFDRPALNSAMSSTRVKQVCQLDVASEAFLDRAYRNMKLTARSLNSVLKVSRTIADLAGEANILQVHIAEALHYRRIDHEVLADV